jgi:hypothetical protein
MTQFGYVNTLGGNFMSWFKRIPHTTTPPKPQPYHHSPTTERKLEEVKRSVKAKTK